MDIQSMIGEIGIVEICLDTLIGTLFRSPMKPMDLIGFYYWDDLGQRHELFLLDVLTSLVFEDERLSLSRIRSDPLVTRIAFRPLVERQDRIREAIFEISFSSECERMSSILYRDRFLRHLQSRFSEPGLIHDGHDKVRNILERITDYPESGLVIENPPSDVLKKTYKFSRSPLKKYPNPPSKQNKISLFDSYLKLQPILFNLLNGVTGSPDSGRVRTHLLEVLTEGVSIEESGIQTLESLSHKLIPWLEADRKNLLIEIRKSLSEAHREGSYFEMSHMIQALNKIMIIEGIERVDVPSDSWIFSPLFPLSKVKEDSEICIDDISLDAASEAQLTRLIQYLEEKNNYGSEKQLDLQNKIISRLIKKKTD